MQHELSHDGAEEGFHEIQLSGKQLVFLFMTVTIVSVFIFLCGVLVGRGARDIRGLEAVDTSVSAAAPASESAPAQPIDAGGSAQEPPTPAESAADLVYPKSLERGGDTAERLTKPAAEPPPAPPTAAPRQPVAQQQPPAATPQPAAAPALDVPTSGRPGTHAVQVLASRDRNVAAALVRDLKKKGYPAFLVLPESPSVPQRYKVQVGRYSQREAEQASGRLEKEEKLKPWVTSAR